MRKQHWQCCWIKCIFLSILFTIDFKWPLSTKVIALLWASRRKSFCLSAYKHFIFRVMSCQRYSLLSSALWLRIPSRKVLIIRPPICQTPFWVGSPRLIQPRYIVNDSLSRRRGPHPCPPQNSPIRKYIKSEENDSRCKFPKYLRVSQR